MRVTCTYRVAITTYSILVLLVLIDKAIDDDLGGIDHGNKISYFSSVKMVDVYNVDLLII